MFAAERLSYKQTGFFSNIVIDYLEGKDAISSFYSSAPDLAGMQQALDEKKNHRVNRKTLTGVLHEQYRNVPVTSFVKENLDLLLNENTFTICTAHQPNLFTGPLYFIYKILHAIQLAKHLQSRFNEYNFVPVFYMGCEDADLDELNNFTISGKKYVWKTNQKGAVGRMKANKELLQLIEEAAQQISVEPFGSEWIDLLKKYFTNGKEIQVATFELINDLFGEYGLVVLIPDHKDLKRQMIQVFEDDLFNNKSVNIVRQTSERLQAAYDVQAHAREINLFYLRDDVRERIELRNSKYEVKNTRYSFTEEELQNELHQHPERFSPNVILRGLFQETILPNIAFIGGGGELAYWLQLKELFDYYNVPFPVQVLRNSFLIIEKKWSDLMYKLQLNITDLFSTDMELLNSIIEWEGKRPELNGEIKNLAEIYQQLKAIATSYDHSLGDHVDALGTKTLSRIQELQKKMLRAERKKHDATQRQITRLKQMVFPNGNLQERVENIGSFYSKWGRSIIESLLQHSQTLEQEFTVLIKK